jgi:hypothetical protein
MMVILTLWDFMLLDIEWSKNLLFDNKKLSSYIDKALIPLV